MTLKALAEQCGLSVSTVSKALNGYSDISPATRDLVQRMAAKMGYQPNVMARGLKTGRTFNLGVLYSDDTDSGFTHSFFGPILQSFKRETESRGYDLTFITHRLSGSVMTYLEHCRYRNVDGVCVICAPSDRTEIAALMASPLPAVTVDVLYKGHTCIQSDNVRGMQALTRYILSMGHRRVAMIRGHNADNAVPDLRQAIFVRTMAEAGIMVPDQYIVRSQFHNLEDTRRATARLLALSERPTCILMPDDKAALGGLAALRAAGLRVPEDISVAGYDGVDWMQQISPRLTTVRQDTRAIGRLAADHLIGVIESPRAEISQIVSVPSELIRGETVLRLG